MVVRIINMERFEFGRWPGLRAGVFRDYLEERYIEFSEQDLHQFQYDWKAWWR